MERLCEGRVVVITGAGRGLGRAHALLFAEHGAKVVVNDLGAGVEGEGSSSDPADEVVSLIRDAGGEAVANGNDISDWDGALRLVETAIETFGGLDTLVCNAGVLRDRMLVNMTADDFDVVIRVHLRGHFCPLRHAASYWRDQAKAGSPMRGRAVLTSSMAGMYGNVGQFNYAAAKSGIATMARVAGEELKRYGATVNAIAPSARTRMTEALFPELMARPEAGAFDGWEPENVSPMVVWLGSDAGGAVTGQTFEVTGGVVSVMENWHVGPTRDRGDRWEPAALGDVVPDLVSASHQVSIIGTQG